MPLPHFEKGDKVEVTKGDDDDNSSSCCSWFPASILRPFPAKHKGQIYVQYETHSEEDDTETETKRRRREYVSASNVRPSPPLELHRYFKVGENVDAFHDKAWRRGTIKDILEESRYAVSFEGVLEEQLEFDQWNLRLHRDWEDGSWVPPFHHQVIQPKELKLRIKFSGTKSDAKFSKGTMVEVGGVKEGFQVSWYAAVIVDLIGIDKFLVEYQTVKTLNGTALLKDSVDASNIRPCPPETPQISHFKKFQEVDAWHRDGWWVSDIVNVLDDYNYRVYVRSTNEEVTLEHSNLRLHQDWIDGKWVTASRRSSGLELKSRKRDVEFKVKVGGRTSKAKFKEGTLVEVKSDDEGYHGSWFTAVIVGSLGEDKFLIEYQTLKSEDEAQFLKEKTEASHLRPCPPDIQRVDRFKLFEKVDAWYNDGWWVGLVSRVLDGLKYAVYFWTTNEELEFGHFSLRPHQEWIHGKWVADFRKKASVLSLKPRPGKSNCQNGLMTAEANYFCKGMKVEVKSDKEGFSGSWYPAVIIGSIGTGKYLVEYRTLKSDDENKLLKEEADAPCIRPCHPVIQRKDPFEPLEEVDAWYNAAWWAGGVCKVLKGSKYEVYIRGTNEVLEFQHSDLRPHQDWTDGKWHIPCRVWHSYAFKSCRFLFPNHG
ncbi:protein AGENET DOMAIN (AGD)-CONTAINING P1-like isoform X1 [Rhododendron vialii]|uniref:protein AGENET DOMAIN (AGD)-CONTAINING P1-like isoform X1 n=1 Tax=Rhododendron vialii TaxID=182163 RepID=UPI00265EEC6C|nr:protein AGENET DOMAIN (AGD)-CONTAINING P1-like isoform X1 [Rhododendron vialii]